MGTQSSEVAARVSQSWLKVPSAGRFDATALLAPPVVRLEEADLGLHPDAIRLLGELLMEASQRTQLIVTAHSDPLVDQFTGNPEAVVVFEKHEGSTLLKRLNGKQLSSWLDRYSLGQLWRTGEIGGNRF